MTLRVSHLRRTIGPPAHRVLPLAQMHQSFCFYDLKSTAIYIGAYIAPLALKSHALLAVPPLTQIEYSA